MAQQVSGFVLRAAAKVNVYHLVALSLVLGAVIMGMPIGGGGGV